MPESQSDLQSPGSDGSTPPERTVLLAELPIDRIRVKKRGYPLVPEVWEGARHHLSAAQVEAWRLAHPVIVRKVERAYELRVGHDRLVTARALGLESVWAVIAEPRSAASIGSSYMDSVVRPLLHHRTKLKTDVLLKELTGSHAPFFGVKLERADLAKIADLSPRTLARRLERQTHG